MSHVAAPRPTYTLGALVIPKPGAFPPDDVAPGVHRIVHVPTGKAVRYRTEPLAGAGKGVRGPAESLLAFTGTLSDAYRWRESPPAFAHPNPVGATPELDLRARWRPTPEQVRAAVAELLTKTDPTEWVAAVALVQPGKQYGIWTVGQPVEPVPGVWAGINSFTEAPSYAHARNDAADAARAALGGRPGTVAHVSVRLDGSFAVFEDFGTRED